jgi:glutathione S-transferase
VKLYNADLSPFASRTRLQLYAKGLEVEMADPPGGLSSDAYKRVNPTGRVPALEVDGAVIPESDAIAEFLEDRFPEPALRPADDLTRARMRVIMRVVDSYLFPPAHALFGQLDPQTRDAALVRARLAEVRPALDLLERLVSADPFAVGRLSLADCTLMPLFFFLVRLLPMLGDASPLDGRPRLAAWWQAVLGHPAAARVNAELEKALQAFLAER